MWGSCKLQLIQPAAGRRPGADMRTEKWILVRFVHSYTASLAQVRSKWELYGVLADYPLQGRYFIESNNITPGDSSSFTIGGLGTQNKIWRYHPQDLTLHFSTISTYTGKGAMSIDPNPVEVTDDLELYDVMFTGRGFEPNNGADYSNGFVDVPSWIRPFEKRSIFWTSV